MTEGKDFDPARRRFLTVVPVCAAMCAAARAAGQQPAGAPAQPTPGKHPFDAEIPQRPTYRQMMNAMMNTSQLIPLLLFMTRTMGREKSLSFPRSFAEASGPGAGKDMAKRLGGTDFGRLKKMFSPETYTGRVVMEVVESTETTHEIEVTECLWAKTYRDAGAGDEGYALICHADFGFARGFNPKIAFTRDKTLMQGHAFCNHRYALKA